MLVEFLTPEKFPKSWAKVANQESAPILTISLRSKKIGLSVGLFKALNALEQDFSKILLMDGQDTQPDSTTKQRSFLAPSKTKGWIFTKNDKTKIYTFTCTSLVIHLKKAWNIREDVNVLKIPVFIELQEVQGIKCLEINLSYVKKEYGNSNQNPNQ